jgi:TetR/AcrR family transcriptional regulator
MERASVAMVAQRTRSTARRAAETGEAERPIRNAEQTRARIIEIATLEFAEKGYDGARVDEIVLRCGVSKNLIYHYFGGKEDLFIAVMELTYRRMRERQNDWSFADLSPKEGIEKLVLYTFEHFLEEPTVIPLLNTENLHKARHIVHSKSIPSLYNPLIEAIGGLVRRGQEAGDFRGGVDPIDLYITLSGLSYFYISNHYTLSHLFGEDLMAPKRVAQRKQHVVDVVLGYLRAT